MKIVVLFASPSWIAAKRRKRGKISTSALIVLFVFAKALFILAVINSSVINVIAKKPTTVSLINTANTTIKSAILFHLS